MTPAEQASYDQAHAAALADLEDLVAVARRLVDEHGPQGAAPAMLNELLMIAAARAAAGSNAARVIVGTAALALVELARREVG